MKKSLSILLAMLLILSLFGCAKAQESEVEHLTEIEQVPEEIEEPITVAVCMGSINHPVHRIVQTGFMLKAEELGMNGVISGLDIENF